MDPDLAPDLLELRFMLVPGVCVCQIVSFWFSSMHQSHWAKTSGANVSYICASVQE